MPGNKILDKEVLVHECTNSSVIKEIPGRLGNMAQEIDSWTT